jgi:thioredoxin-like negative regulator of GroEL
MTVKELFYTKATDLDKLILLFFYANKDQKNQWNKIIENLEETKNIHLFSVDITQHPELAKSFNVIYTPKLLIILNGKELGRYRQEQINQALIEEMIEEMKKLGFLK